MTYVMFSGRFINEHRYSTTKQRRTRYNRLLLSVHWRVQRKHNKQHLETIDYIIRVLRKNEALYIFTALHRLLRFCLVFFYCNNATAAKCKCSLSLPVQCLAKN